MKGIVLFGHGSRDPLWREPMDAVAQRIGAQRPEVAVRCAFLELQAPTLVDAASELASKGVRDITVLPMFLGAGRHAREDLPRLLQEAREANPAVRFALLPAVGQDPKVLDLIAALALQ